jgi:autotransporter-associated beta strand protein
MMGASSYSGATTINDGSLILTAGGSLANSAVTVNAPADLELWFTGTIGSLSGAGSVSILAGQQLTTGADNRSTTYSGVILDSGGAGNLAKTGTGTFTLSNTSTYTGATTVDGGTLSVNGSIASSSLTTVNASGTLSGNGTVGDTTINGGTLAPGNSIGTLTVAGNLVLTSASTYMVEVSPTNADRVNVTGMATLGGATVNAVFAAGSYITKQYTIVNATGGLGGSTFGSQVNTSLPSSFTSSLSYDANNAYLNLTLAFIPPVGSGLNANQQAVGNTLVNYFNRTGGIPLVFGGLTGATLTQVSGETGTGSQQTTFDAMNMFMGIMSDPFSAGRGDASGAVPFADEAMAYAGKRRPSDALAAIYKKAPPMAPAFQERWNVWVAGFGGSQTTDGNAAAGSNKFSSSIYGTAVGADYWFSPDTVAGFSLAGGGTNFSVANGGSGHSDLFQAGAFARHTVGSAYVTAAVAYGWQDITTDRTVTVAGIDRLRAEFNANSYSGRVEIGNRWVMPWMSGVGITPYAAAQVTAFDLPSYAESSVAGATTFALAYSGKTVTATRSELGLRSDKSFAVNDAMLTLRGRAAWAHDYNTDRSANATFQTLPGASFTVNGAAGAADVALTTASAELKWMNGWAVAATFDGEFSDVTESYSGKGVVRYAW